MNGFLISGTASGVGKTTVTLAILACLRRRGLKVQPFKGGPDFLDTTHHTRIAGRTARNLDTWMLSAEANHDVLNSATRDADALIVEGMMGLFDGKDGATETGSSAEIAKLLKLPVLLVVDCAKIARSIAAVVHGFESFDPELSLAGIILNRVASDKHYKLLSSAIEARCKTPILGWLPRESQIAIPERHLGLHAAVEDSSAKDTGSLDQELDFLANLAEKHLQVDEILKLQCGLDVLSEPSTQKTTSKAFQHPLRIGVARDRAFSFYYEDNLDLLREQGAELIPFSPVADSHLPANLDALYLGGGYPELYAQPLSRNTRMLDEIRNFARSGKHIYAECGGMIYLSECLISGDGVTYPMTGILPLTTEMTGKLVDFGYVTVQFTEDCILGPRGTTIRGHSFHYSRIAPTTQITTSYAVQFSLSGKEQLEGFTQGNILASYVHLHFRANPTVVENFVATLHHARNAQQVSA
jgi:cobyrinic acid a,c-diamide synthase